MNLDINWEEESIPEDDRGELVGLLEQGIEKAIRLSNGPEEAEVSLTLVNDARIHELNRDYRGVDRPTDVLSFALQEETEDEPDILDYEDDLLGDIIISVERARNQAADYEHSFERELVYLAVHGTLHLLGYDHMEEEEKEKMRQQEEAVMSQIGLLR
ncbi:MAG TPA: rRNA maturation RNase YbeY [Desulfitobacterium dehalogenans]|uniref:Endoribonuclease YbeY n=1 Tax=Desulfitobacterium dehalogenans TaxID=36854 RepID=A0A7C6Z6X1_9FIRM|nr:rRNA maturation RNase YbeY [Desulfitobacterium dehalogenans]